MDSLKDFMVLREGYGSTRPFNTYKTFEMFATAPENILKATKVLQEFSAHMNSTFNSNLDPKTGIKKGEATKSYFDAFKYAIDQNSSIYNGGQILQAMAIAQYVVTNYKSKVDENEDHGKSNEDFMAKVKLHFATNAPKDSQGNAKDLEAETSKLVARINALRTIYNTVSAKGKNIHQAFKSALDTVSNTRNYYDSNDFIGLNNAFVKKNVPPVPPRKNVATDGDEQKEEPVKPEGGEESSENLDTSTEEPQKEEPKKTEAPLDIENYRKQINDIVDAKIEELKKRYNIQEEVLKAVDNTLNEMFRKTHDDEGNETEYYQKKKGLSNDRLIQGQIEDIRKKAIKKLEELFGIYNDKIITNNKKASIKIKIKQLIPQLELDLNKVSQRMSRSLTQNEVGIGIDAAAKDIKNAASTVKNTVTGSAAYKKAADAAKVVGARAKDIASATAEKAKDAKETFDKNVDAAKEVHAQGGDAGVVGKVIDARKAVNDKLKNVFFGRKQAAQTKKQPAPAPQAALPAPQVAAAPQQPVAPAPQPQSPPAVIYAPAPAPQAALPAPATTQPQDFKPKLKDDEEEKKRKQASVDTQKKKIRKINESIKNRIK